jgi:hypothetical protein
MQPSAATAHEDTYELQELENGRRWLLTLGDGIAIEARGIGRDGEVIRAVLTVRRADGVLLHRAHVNLTSDRTRTRFASAVLSQCGVSIPTRSLLALDEALRTPGCRRREKKPDTPSDFSGTPPTFAKLQAVIGEYLLIRDPDTLAVPLASVAAHRLSGDPVWLLIVAPPSGLKSELVMLLSALSGAFPVSKLTARTFASGLTTDGDDPSLLARLTNEILLIKDFTTVLEMPSDERRMILAQLREIYDGRYDEVWGTGKELHWRGRLGFVAGVTSVIDRHHRVMAVLGQRFVLFRPEQPDRRETGERAIDNSGRANERQTQQALAEQVAAFINGLPGFQPVLLRDQVRTLVKLADYVTRARSGVERDGQKRDLDYAPAPEGTGRFARQLASLARGFALVGRRLVVDETDIARVVRVALDSIPAVRRYMLDALVKGNVDLATPRLSDHVQHGKTTQRRALEDLQSLGLVIRHTGPKNSILWSLSGEFRSIAESFCEKSEGPADLLNDSVEGHLR